VAVQVILTQAVQSARGDKVKQTLKEYVKGSETEEQKKKKICWVDLETGGLDKNKHSILTIGIIIEIDGIIYDKTYLTCKSYTEEVSPKALEANGLTLKEIQEHEYDKQTLYTTIKGILDKYVKQYNKLDKFFFGGFNCSFDRAFLEELWKMNGDGYCGSYFHGGAIDVQAILNFLYANGKIGFPDGTHKLSDFVRFMNIPIEGNMHNSLTDIEATKKIYELCVNKLKVEDDW
jgi:oligoribonuclease (3'-5' exoribonuclease)